MLSSSIHRGKPFPEEVKVPVEAAAEESRDRLEGEGGEVDVVDHLGRWKLIMITWKVEEDMDVDQDNHDVGGKGL